MLNKSVQANVCTAPVSAFIYSPRRFYYSRLKSFQHPARLLNLQSVLFPFEEPRSEDLDEFDI